MDERAYLFGALQGVVVPGEAEEVAPEGVLEEEGGDVGTAASDEVVER